jgi:hypothetical protein
MPVKTGEISSIDYKTCKEAVYSLEVGNTTIIDIDDYKRCQKYIYEIGLKCKPRREFSTKKLTQYSLRITRII